MRKKTKALVCLAAVCLLLTAAFLGCAEKTEKTVSVQSVAMLMDVQTGQISRYGGVVVSQNEKTIKRDETKTIQEILVKEGDLVEEGQILVTYDQEDMKLTIQKAELELEQLRNSITTYGEQIAQLEKEKAKAPASEQLSYTVQIQELALDRKEAEYNVTVKEAELQHMRDELSSNEVLSPVTGRIQSLNPDGGTGANGEPLPLITIVESGTFRVKGQINELNRGELFEGTNVIVRSRADETQYWTGVITVINWNDPEASNQNNMYDGPVISDEASLTASSNYPFYVELDSVEGLLLGQHVFIEPDYGQEDMNGEIWIEDGYLNEDAEGTFVWAASARSLLEKRYVTAGEHDDDLGKTLVTEGLALADYIAWPHRDLKAGMPVVSFDETSFDDAVSGLEQDDISGEPEEGEFFTEEGPYEEMEEVYEEEVFPEAGEPEG